MLLIQYDIVLFCESIPVRSNLTWQRVTFFVFWFFLDPTVSGAGGTSDRDSSGYGTKKSTG